MPLQRVTRYSVRYRFSPLSVITPTYAVGRLQGTGGKLGFWNGR